MDKRVRSGIPKLDRLIEGGYPKNSVILVLGGPGTGKTTFALQYIYNGAKNGEPGVFVSFEQEPEQLKNSMRKFGLDFAKLEKQKKAIILRMKNVKDITDVLKTIDKNVKKIKAKRLVIDSLSSIEIFASTYKSIIKSVPAWVLKEKLTLVSEQKTIIRKLIYEIIDHFKGLKVTTLLTSESEDAQHSGYSIAEYIVDGIIVLTVHRALDTRKLEIVKMRETSHTLAPQTIKITNKGIEILKS